MAEVARSVVFAETFCGAGKNFPQGSATCILVVLNFKKGHETLSVRSKLLLGSWVFAQPCVVHPHSREQLSLQSWPDIARYFLRSFHKTYLSYPLWRLIFLRSNFCTLHKSDLKILSRARTVYDWRETNWQVFRFIKINFGNSRHWDRLEKKSPENETSADRHPTPHTHTLTHTYQLKLHSWRPKNWKDLVCIC